MHESVCMKPLLFVQQEIMIKERQLFSTFIVTRKNPFQISFADGIFALQPMFSYGQRSKCADLLNSYRKTSSLELFRLVLQPEKLPKMKFFLCDRSDF